MNVYDSDMNENACNGADNCYYQYLESKGDPQGFLVVKKWKKSFKSRS